MFLHVFLFFSGGYFFVILSRGERKTKKKKENNLATELMWEGGSGEQPFWVLFEEQKKRVGWKSIYHIPVIQGQKTNKMGFFASLD